MASETTQPFKQGLRELQKILGEEAQQLLSEPKVITDIKREDFISRSFRHEDGPTIKQRVDGYIYEVVFDNGSRTYVLRHKSTEGNPFADPAVFGSLGLLGLDMRRWVTFIYQWDGEETITSTEPNGNTIIQTGEYGTPDAMLPTLRESLGHHRGVVNFTQTSSEE